MKRLLLLLVLTACIDAPTSPPIITDQIDGLEGGDIARSIVPAGCASVTLLPNQGVTGVNFYVVPGTSPSVCSLATSDPNFGYWVIQPFAPLPGWGQTVTSNPVSFFAFNGPVTAYAVKKTAPPTLTVDLTADANPVRADSLTTLRLTTSGATACTTTGPAKFVSRAGIIGAWQSPKIKGGTTQRFISACTGPAGSLADTLTLRTQ